MHLFFSAGEPSGDLHGANSIRELRKLDPGVVASGFGGERMRAAGCQLVYPLCDMAVMGLGPVLRSLPRFVGLLRTADQFFGAQRPDAVVLIDYPGFNWWVARKARAHGIPVFYFVPPQIWGWASWRVRKMRRLVDQVLCTLPFEEEWYRARGGKMGTLLTTHCVRVACG
jgi:lipid-A-disaccharide synthase